MSAGGSPHSGKNDLCVSRRVRVGLKILLEPYTFMFPIPATAARPAGQRVLTVSQLSLVIKETLEELLPAVWVSGEVTDLRRPRSGHIYFDLKDASAVINAVVWKSTAARTRFERSARFAMASSGVLAAWRSRSAISTN